VHKLFSKGILPLSLLFFASCLSSKNEGPGTNLASQIGNRADPSGPICEHNLPSMTLSPLTQGNGVLFSKVELTNNDSYSCSSSMFEVKAQTAPPSLLSASEAFRSLSVKPQEKVSFNLYLSSQATSVSYQLSVTATYSFGTAQVNIISNATTSSPSPNPSSSPSPNPSGSPSGPTLIITPSPNNLTQVIQSKPATVGVTVRNLTGNAVSGVTVTWNSSGCPASGLSSTTSSTDSNGMTTFLFTPSREGACIITASNPRAGVISISSTVVSTLLDDMFKYTQICGGTVCNADGIIATIILE
jgi:hypothetical protein